VLLLMCLCCRRAGAAGLEDGTLPFTAIAAARHGFSQLQRLGGLPAISRHTACLSWHLMQQLMQLQHSNGLPVAVLYCAPAVRQLLLDHKAGCKHEQGPSSSTNSSSNSSGSSCSSDWVVPEPSVLACFRERQGPVVCFNLLRPDGSWVGHKEVAKLAAIHNICLRTGMQCKDAAASSLYTVIL
jgi:molybdenum cofactor sulfurtransferase